MDPNLTERQQEIYDFICSYHQQEAYFPSLREIAAHFKVSIGTVQTHLDYLKRKGVLSWEKGKPRALKVSKRSNLLEESISNFIAIPLLGQVSAGPGLLAEENIEETLYLPGSFVRYNQGDMFALRVHGDSMMNAGIYEQDLVVVRVQKEANHGEIIVGLIQEEAVVKRFYRQNGKIQLISENEAYAPRDVDETFQILGKVIHLLRTY